MNIKDRLIWFVGFEPFFIIGAVLDIIFTAYGVQVLGFREIHPLFTPWYSLIFATFLNAVFIGLKPTWRYQLVRVPFVLWVWHPFVRNLLLWVFL